MPRDLADGPGLFWTGEVSSRSAELDARDNAISGRTDVLVP